MFPGVVYNRQRIAKLFAFLVQRHRCPSSVSRAVENQVLLRAAGYRSSLGRTPERRPIELGGSPRGRPPDIRGSRPGRNPISTALTEQTSRSELRNAEGKPSWLPPGSPGC